MFRSHMGLVYYFPGLKQCNLENIECIVYQTPWILHSTLGELKVTLSEKLIGQFLDALKIYLGFSQNDGETVIITTESPLHILSLLATPQRLRELSI